MLTKQLVRKIPVAKSELRLDITLQCGQSFRWREIAPGKWRGVIGKNIWTLFQDDTHLFYEKTVPDISRIDSDNKKLAHQSKRMRTNVRTRKIEKVDEQTTKSLASTVDDDQILKDYFQLNISLEKMYSQWSRADANFASVCPNFPGVRMLNQDPVENVFSFICSSNNNIQRITSLVEKLCLLYGTPLGSIEDNPYYSFPSVGSLGSPGVEETLRNHGFGYRAKYIQNSAQKIMENGGSNWLHSLRSLPYPECHAQLASLNGIGAKVSDCICLMSMGHLDAIPVDTHVFQIAVRDYLPHLSSCKTVTDRVYKEIADHFRKVFGEYAGWAHSVLFSADLRKFDGLKDQEKKNITKPKKNIKSQR